MHRLAGTAALLLLALLMVGTAAAQFGDNQVYYINSGLAIVQKPDIIHDLWKTGYTVGAGMGMPVDEDGRLVAKALVDYSSCGLDEGAVLKEMDITSELATVSGGATTIFNGALSLSLGTGKDLPVSPFVSGEVGVVRVRIGDALVSVADSSLQIASSTESKVSFGLGAGIKIPINQTVSVALEGFYRVGLTSDQRLHYIPLRVGLAFRK